MTRVDVLLAGSGKMARNIGLHLLERGLDVAWVSRNDQRLAALEASMWPRSRKFSGKARFALADDAPAGRVLLESVEELEASKRAIFALAPKADELILSNSSSILPLALHDRAAGLHFFYPVGETRLAEAILPTGYRDRVTLEGFAQVAGLQLLVQDERSAFITTRLLLPLQAAAFRCLAAGCAPREVDQASESDLLPIGILTLMDAIGLDVLAAATARFQARCLPDEAAVLDPLVHGLQRLVGLGKLGRKNRDGLLMGAPLPWSERSASVEDGLARQMSTACAAALQRGLIDAADLNRVLADVWGATRRYPGLEDALGPTGQCVPL